MLHRYNHDSTIYTFGLPDDVSLALPVCACLLMRASGRGRVEGGAKDAWDGSDAVRPYTPISDNAMVGKFELLVKRYPDGAASEWLHGLELGSMVAFKHIKFNIKARNLLRPAPPCRRTRVPSAHALPRPRRQAQYPFEGKKKFLMLCAGTGITPMYQARVARHAERASRRGVETCGVARCARLISARSSMCVPRGHRRCGSFSARRAMTARW